MWGVTTPDGPLVLPMAYGRDDDRLYLHGAAANHLLGTGDGDEICVTVTHLDGLVMARTPFHNSMNYRSVVVRGRARRIADEDRKRHALKRITDHIVANWDTSRPPSEIGRAARRWCWNFRSRRPRPRSAPVIPSTSPTTSPGRGGPAWSPSPPVSRRRSPQPT